MSRTAITLWVIATLAVVVAALFWANRPRRIVVDADPPIDFPAEGFSHAGFEALMQTYVRVDGRVDYARWHRSANSRARLRSYLAAVGRYSPDSAPDRFPGRNDALAYWLHAYNAYVIHSVLEHWPLSSVTDLKAPIEAVKGLGFFYQRRFSFGGEFMSLYSVENDRIRGNYKDPRIHFFLNCGSEGCPVARPDVPAGSELDALLSQAATEFINETANVKVDHENETIFLSMIFKWYESDFVNALRQDGKPVANGLYVYVAQYAAGDLAAALSRAGGYRIEFIDYDWDLNASH